MRKAYLYLVVLVSLTYSCGGGDGEDGGPDSSVNNAPTVPSQVYPLNNTLCIDNEINFQWNASSDEDGDAISYELEISEMSDFSSLIKEKEVGGRSTTILLEKGKSFYWRVRALDARNMESDFSAVSQFLTEGEGVSNHLPFAPELVSPELDETIGGANATLSWTANDVDNDSLLFDVYLDTASAPVTKISENQTATTFNATGLTAATTYYFKVVVKDGKGGVTIGQIWSFKTN
ncbi:fibronectin type III domain-containing protein [Flavicella sediminum]|uniref:fibronectin type III domain-containing protein n=1 Tax=Flavicella sediminum TaxID=2585141 RepID=UPI0011214BB7|nr:fibronectin type III domain-containing protein [Flavicella sediminum]